MRSQGADLGAGGNPNASDEFRSRSRKKGSHLHTAAGNALADLPNLHRGGRYARTARSRGARRQPGRGAASAFAAPREAREVLGETTTRRTVEEALRRVPG